MQAINYIVRDQAGIVQHGSLMDSGISDQISLGNDGAISLNMRRTDVREYLRAGENLELYLADGRKIVIEGFFAENGVQENRLYLNEDGALIEASLDASGHVTFTEAAAWGKWSQLDALVFPDDVVVADTLIAGENEVATQGLGLGLLGAAGGAGAALPIAGAGILGAGLLGGGGGSRTPGDTTATVDDADKPVTVGGGDDKSITVTGTAEPGSTVEVTIGGKTVTTTTGDDGKWTATFEGDNFPGDGNHTVTVKVTEIDGTTHEPEGPGITIDTTPPAVDVTYGTEESGIVVNADDHSDGVEIKGKGEAGASVKVEIDGVVHTTTVGEDGNWSVTFASSEIRVGEYKTEVKITSTDAYNNATVVTETLVVDTVSEVTLSGGFAGSDDLVNVFEADAGLTLTGTSQPGSTVSVNFHGTTLTATVAADGSWSVDVPPSAIAEGKYEASIKVTATDAHGNVKSINSSVDIDTTAAVAFSSTAVEGDNVINYTEASDGVILTGQALPGSTVMITMDGGNTYPATVAADGSWSVTFPAGDFTSGEYDATFTANATAASGNTSSATLTVEVDTLVKNFAMNAHPELADNAATPIADANVLTASEVQDGLSLSGTSEAGSTVVVQLGGASKTITVGNDGIWTADFSASEIPGDGTVWMTVTATDQAGNVNEIKQSVIIDTNAGDVALSSAPIELDDVINAVEASNGVDIQGTATPNMDVTVWFGGASMVVQSSPTGQWTAHFNSVPADSDAASISASITDQYGNSKTVTDTVKVDTIVEDFAQTSGAVAGDDVINSVELGNGVQISGTVEAHSTVVVKIGTATQTVNAGANGQWAVEFDATDINGLQGNTFVEATATDPAGNVKDLPDHAIKIDTIVENFALSNAPIAGDGIINAAEAEAGVTFAGTTEIGSQVWISFDNGATYFEADVDANGDWDVTLDDADLPSGNNQTVSLTIKAQDAAGNIAYDTDDTFDIDTVAPDAPDATVYINNNTGDINGVFVSGDTSDFTMDELNSDGTVTDVRGLNLNSFDPVNGLQDGTDLIVTEHDDAGNQTSTLYVTADAGGVDADLSAAGLSSFNIEAIDLFAGGEANELTITEQQLLDLSQNSNELTIHGGADDTVNLNGAKDTNMSVAIGGSSYDVYELGVDGGTLYIQQGITVEDPNPVL